MVLSKPGPLTTCLGSLKAPELKESPPMVDVAKIILRVIILLRFFILWRGVWRVNSHGVSDTSNETSP